MSPPKAIDGHTALNICQVHISRNNDGALTFVVEHVQQAKQEIERIPKLLP
jgi:hypothetical protein